ncbi:hypothetical protein [Alicyclobacillus sp. SO9]|uniref:hypothetical protein n=1 Tax=Alicyclobacillus sp. SO9 TaxID=2665646 RepID=UPI0018E840E0|nr:hypothetical protein [Alicyclobacillus sp. SO9]QQE78229.1 hypothetical protein GI364_20460 [Alicyclobacillus sp. SO9]
MNWRNTVHVLIIVVVLCSEAGTLFFTKPHYLIFNSIVSVFFLFVSGLMLFDFTYKRRIKTILGIFIYGFTSLVSLIFSEAVTLMYISYLYPSSFHHHSYSNADALGNALILITGYGYPKVLGEAHAFIILLMLYSWIVNVLLISKLIHVLSRKIT